MKTSCTHSVSGGEADWHMQLGTRFTYDGILGLSGLNLNFMRVLERNGVIDYNMVVQCIKKNPQTEKQVGFIIFGRPAFIHSFKDLKWAPMRGYYYFIITFYSFTFIVQI